MQLQFMYKKKKSGKFRDKPKGHGSPFMWQNLLKLSKILKGQPWSSWSYMAYYICNEPRGGHDLGHTKNEQTRSVDGII